MTEETMNPRTWITNRRIHDEQYNYTTPELHVVDADGYYWYECLICDELLYSEWTVGMARIESTNELVSFCANHSNLEIHRMTRIVESPVLDLLADKPRGN